MLDGDTNHTTTLFFAFDKCVDCKILALNNCLGAMSLLLINREPLACFVLSGIAFSLSNINYLLPVPFFIEQIFHDT